MMEIIEEIISEKGLIKKCPICENSFWINISWPGLPIWNLPKNPDEESGPFLCPWCQSKLAVKKERKNIESLTIVIINRSEARRDYKLFSPLLISPNSLIKIIEMILLTYSTPPGFKNNGDRFFMNINYGSKEVMRSDILKRIKIVIQNGKIVPLPVLEV